MRSKESRLLRFEQCEERWFLSPVVPAYDSLPGAKVALYLDFDGDFQATWGPYRDITTPAYDQDGDPTTFSDAELEAIDRIWRIVAEDYSPFKINVTTVPVPLVDGVSVAVDIGGDWRDWLQQPAGGVAWLDGFRGPEPNIAYVFSASPIAALWPKTVAETVSHEAGHLFGLLHQSRYDDEGWPLDQYNAGDETYYSTAPIMGRSGWATRGTWWRGLTDSMFNEQDDFAVLASLLGLRADDHQGTAAKTTKLVPFADEFSARGRIGTPADADWFRLDLKAPSLLTVQVITPSMSGSFLDPRLDVVGNLDPVLEVWDRTGRKLLGRDAPPAAGIEETNLDASITLVLPAGSYRLVVSGDGSMGNVGNYTFSGTIVPAPAAPGRLRAILAGAAVALTWLDRSSSETGFIIERSSDFGRTWGEVGCLGVDANGFTDSLVESGRTYWYRVRAYGDGGVSAAGNVARLHIHWREK